MKLNEIVQQINLPDQNPVQLYHDYVHHHYFSDLFLIAQQPKEKDIFETQFMLLHTAATKKLPPNDQSINRNLKGMYEEMKSFLPIMTGVKNTLVEWVETEKEINLRTEQVSQSLQKHKSSIIKLASVNASQTGFVNKMVEHYGTIVKTKDKSLPTGHNLNSLEGCIQFITDLNKLFTSEEIIQRFSSFAFITVNYLLFNEMITTFRGGLTENLPPQDIEAFTSYLIAPIQRLTRLVLLVKTLQKEDKLKLFSEPSSSLLRKLLRVCQAINQLQKISQHEVAHKSQTLNVVDQLFKLLNQTFINADITSNNINIAVSNNLLFSVMSVKPITETKSLEEVLTQNAETTDENQLASSLLEEALCNENANENDVTVDDSFYNQLTEIEQNLKTGKKPQMNSSERSLNNSNQVNRISRSLPMEQRRSSTQVTAATKVTQPSPENVEKQKESRKIDTITAPTNSSSEKPAESVEPIPQQNAAAHGDSRSIPDWANINQELLKQYQAKLQPLGKNKKLKIANNLITHYQKFEQSIHSLDHLIRVDLQDDANKMLKIVTSDTVSPENKMGAIAAFEILAKSLIPMSAQSGVKIGIAGLIMAAVSAAACALIGTAIGVIVGAATGPGAAVTGFCGLLVGLKTGWWLGIGIASGTTGMLAGGLTSFGMFKTNNEAKDLCNDVRDLIKLEPSNSPQI